ncbi:hypothetical protein EYF80_045389 [Liparis tanakae]|uniref:Uncharacterized protein n=1 Tax=Liparis tanakae TaxID=230148 RepID=A0A4Z2FT55_9TELE|nr:hypothetical protein EYF80_045389 [Liparis tanakae]
MLPPLLLLLLLLLLDPPVLEIVAASGGGGGGGFVARDPVPLLPHAGASVLPVFAGVEAAEVPHDQRLDQQHREGHYQGGPGPAGQPASAQAANHHFAPRACAELEERRLCAARREEGVEVEGGGGGEGEGGEGGGGGGGEAEQRRAGETSRRGTGPPCGEKVCVVEPVVRRWALLGNSIAAHIINSAVFLEANRADAVRDKAADRRQTLQRYLSI